MSEVRGESSEIRRIAFLADDVPRKCGIAAFTSDLLAAVATEYPSSQGNQGAESTLLAFLFYSCGSLVHGGLLVIPYAMSDDATTFATVPLTEVLAAME